LLGKSFQQVTAFVVAMGLESSLSTDQIEAALTAAHIAADEHYNLAHAEQRNTTFEFPQAAIDEDAALFQQCGNDFTLMCATKQRSLADNRMSLRRIIETFGPTGTRYPTMLHSEICSPWDHTARCTEFRRTRKCQHSTPARTLLKSEAHSQLSLVSTVSS
jgi:hypothetical protein